MNEPKDIESEMMDMFKAAGDSVPQESAPDAQAAPAQEAVAEQPSSDRPRDESGKFVKQEAVKQESTKQPKETTTEKATEAQAKTAPEDKPAEQPQEQDQVQQPAGTDQPVRPPSSWSAAAKAVFDKLDPVVQREVMRREEDFHKGIAEYRQGHQQAQEFMQVISPYMPIIQAEGGTPVGAIQSLLNTAYRIRQDPAGTIQLLAQQYGVDLSQFAQQPNEPLDPRLAAIQHQAHQAQLAAQQAQAWQQQQLAQQAAVVDQQAEQELQAFANDPKHIYLENVRQDMAVLLKEGRARDLQDAYDKACWQNPEVRNVLLQQQLKATESKRIEEAKQKAANAKRAGFDVVGQGSVAAGDRQMSLEEELQSRYHSTST